MNRIKIAITGSICTGKSYVLELLNKQGIASFDSDEAVRSILSSDDFVMREVERKFPGCVKDKVVDRKKLAKEVFSSGENIRFLEKTLYPKLFYLQKVFFKEHKDEIVVVESPLLFEKKLEGQYDLVIVTKCTKETQLDRATKRGISKWLLEKILENQLDSEEKEALADYVIDTDKTGNNIEEELKFIIEKEV